MDLREIATSTIGIAVVSALAGALATALLTKLAGRTKPPLRYSVHFERLALSAEDPIFGSVRLVAKSTDAQPPHGVHRG